MLSKYRGSLVITHEDKGDAEVVSELARSMFGRFETKYRYHDVHSSDYRGIRLDAIDTFMDLIEHYDLPVSFWIGLSSDNDHNSRHYGMFDFDFHHGESDTEKFLTTFMALKEQRFHGHLYETRGGYHAITDDTYGFDQMQVMIAKMGACDGHASIAQNDGFFTIRTGNKFCRIDDINYVTDVCDDNKGEFIRIHDYLNDRQNALKHKYQNMYGGTPSHPIESCAYDKLGERRSEFLHHVMKEADCIGRRLLSTRNILDV